MSPAAAFRAACAAHPAPRTSSGTAPAPYIVYRSAHTAAPRKGAAVEPPLAAARQIPPTLRAGKAQVAALHQRIVDIAEDTGLESDAAGKTRRPPSAQPPPARPGSATFCSTLAVSTLSSSARCSDIPFSGIPSSSPALANPSCWLLSVPRRRCTYTCASR